MTKISFLLDEEWKIIKDFPDYAVSNYGGVKRVVDSETSKVGKVLKCSIGVRGYLVVGLRKNDKGYLKTVHRLVAEAFIGPCPKGKEVNHIDGDKVNPYVENLEYVTASQNHKHAYELGLERQDGEYNANSKLTESDVKKIRKMYKTGEYTQKELGKKFKVCGDNISHLISGRTWSHI